MSASPRKILVTTALPYANGPLHLGYMVETIQADIWVRFQKMMGHTCHFISADDAHGTPIMLLAQKRGLSPEALIEEIYQSHVKDLKAFEIDFDNFYSSHSPENQELSKAIYEKLLKRGDIVKRSIAQAFDPVKALFLPDRYVKGECPKCDAANQYGDNCEQCGATYTPMDLKNPVSVLSGVPPIQKESEHHFFCLEHYQDFLKQWIETEGLNDHIQPEVRKKLLEWFKTGLAQWDISRDAPYFGFKIPGTQDKYFYVWLDAPIAYMATFKHYCDKQALNFEEYWRKDSQTELYHFLGKDIIYFHGLFWPAILEGAGFRTPTRLFTHGFLTVDGKKMSKSRGTFIQAGTYLNHLEPEYLRYYFASKSNDSIEDMDFQAQDFVSKVNADLVGKWANIASRTASFINKNFKNHLSSLDPASMTLHEPFVLLGDKLKDCYENRQLNMALALIMQLSDQVNQYIDMHKPWVLAKSHNVEDLSKCHKVCSLSLHLFWLLTIYLSPVIPKLAAKAALFLKKDLDWHKHWENRHLFFPEGHRIKTFEPLVQRIDLKTVEAMMIEAQNNLPKNPVDSDASDSKQSKQATLSNTDSNTEASQCPVNAFIPEPVLATIHIDHFSQIDLRVGKVVQAEAVPEAQKLIKLQVDIGEERPRQIFAGIKEAYEPEMLIGKLVAVVANLEPRKMRFGLSEGMLLATGGGGSDKSKVWIIEPNEQSIPGMKIK